MRKHPFRKFLGLTVLYAAVIVGIFVLQFKTESVINKTIGLMHITLAQSESDGQKSQLHNQFKLTYNGFTFSADEEDPAILYTSDRTESTPLVLESFEELSQHSCQFTFTDGSRVAFIQGEDDHSFTIASYPSREDSIIAFSYRVPESNTIDSQTSSRIQYLVKDSYYAFTSYEFASNKIYLSQGDYAATYLAYTPTKEFSLSLVAELENADSSLYNQKIKDIRSTLVSKFNATLNSASADSLTEHQVIAYVAEMASDGKYNEALDTVPSSFKNSSRRTYLSSPYFDNLVRMNQSLTVQTQKYSSLLNSAADSASLDIFTVDDIACYILMQKKKPVAKRVLSIPSGYEEFNPSLLQSAGILNVYASLYEKDRELASMLQSVIEPCIQVITKSCTLDEDTLIIKENDLTPDTMTLVQTGKALIRIGNITGHTEYTKSGYAIINQTLSSISSLSLDTLTALYPVLVDNAYYPHAQLLGYYGSTPVWAWTCARNITYDIDSSDTVNIRIDFPLERTHYVIFSNIPTFHAKIEIQKQMFRTDPRFETYNSSGYVYNSDSQTLFLKSRHKSEMELIRLFCDPASNFTALQ